MANGIVRVGGTGQTFSTLTVSNTATVDKLNVGTATGATQGQVKASADITALTGNITATAGAVNAGTGVNVGTASGAGTGDVRASRAINAGTAVGTTAGNISGSGLLAMTGAGVNALTGMLTISGQPIRSRSRGTTLSIPNAASTAISHDNEITNIGDIVYNAGFWTIGTSGIYLVAIGVTWAANGTGNRGITLNVGGSPVAQQFVPNAGAGLSTCLSVIWLGALTAAQQVTATAYQDSGGALNISATPASFLAIMKIA